MHWILLQSCYCAEFMISRYITKSIYHNIILIYYYDDNVKDTKRKYKTLNLDC